MASPLFPSRTDASRPLRAQGTRRSAAGWRGTATTAWLKLAAGAAALALLLFLAVPLLALVGRGLLDRAQWTGEAAAILRQALGLSLLTSGIALAVIVLLGTPLAYLLARRRFRGARLVDTLIDLPIVLPPAVAGIALLLAFGRMGLIGRWFAAHGITVGFTTAAVVLAQIFIAAPFFVRAAKSGFLRTDRDLEEAAADLGASPLQVLRTVTAPLARPSLLAGAVLAWARALGEFGATIMFAGNFPGITQTMPLAIYGSFGAGDLTAAVLLALVLLLASLLVLGGLRLVGNRAEPFAA